MTAMAWATRDALGRMLSIKFALGNSGSVGSYRRTALPLNLKLIANIMNGLIFEILIGVVTRVGV